MEADVQGNGGGGVTQSLGDHLAVDAGLERRGGVRAAVTPMSA